VHTRNACADEKCLARVMDERFEQLKIEGIGGTQLPVGDVTGTYYTDHSSIMLKQLPNGHVRFQIEASWHYHIGGAEGEFALNGHKAHATDPTNDDNCVFDMTFGQDRIYIAQTGQCGMGMNVTGEGLYIMRSHKSPKFDG
jgi:hypothetical protein